MRPQDRQAAIDRWIKAGKQLAVAPSARVLCPGCQDAELSVEDALFPDGSGLERWMRCPKCKACETLLKRNMMSDPQAATELLIRRYYDRYNAGDVEGMVALVTDDIVLEPGHGGRSIGREAFARILGYTDSGGSRPHAHPPTVMTNADGSRAAAEFQLEGTYVPMDRGLPQAAAQRYVLTVGAFFEVRDGRIARVSNHYDRQDWLRQVGGGAA
jgi:steroid delta-isomerase-like uncharacterized protein